MSLGDVLGKLYTTIADRRNDDPTTSYTASLLQAGPQRCAKKFGEEAVEAALAGALQDKENLTEEAADVLYHLMVLLASNNVTPDKVADTLSSRMGQSGHEEKATRK